MTMRCGRLSRGGSLRPFAPFVVKTPRYDELKEASTGKQKLHLAPLFSPTPSFEFEQTRLESARDREAVR